MRWRHRAGGRGNGPRWRFERNLRRGPLGRFGGPPRERDGMHNVPAAANHFDLELLAANAARGVDLFDRHLCGDVIGLGQGCEGTRASKQISKQDFLRLDRLTGHDR